MLGLHLEEVDERGDGQEEEGAEQADDGAVLDKELDDERNDGGETGVEEPLGRIGEVAEPAEGGTRESEEKKKIEIPGRGERRVDMKDAHAHGEHHERGSGEVAAEALEEKEGGGKVQALHEVIHVWRR